MSGPAGHSERSEESPSAAARILAEEKRSFAFAVAGLTHVWRTQRHMRIHVGIGLVAALCAAALRLGPSEWAVLLLTITAVLVLEMLNTVIESVVDLASPHYHPLAKAAKDVAAGAVLVAAIGSVAVGAALFLPRLWWLLVG
ncbi:MAG TPA: diacylglycerol kinase family protein [Chloroflexota bacterium]|nr:diacylglycerol kinase family protein [Chloroflexota bacterium]